MESLFRRISGEFLAAATESKDIDSLLGRVSNSLLFSPWIDRIVIALCEADTTLPVVRSAAQKPDVDAKLPPVGVQVSYKEEDLAKLASREVSYLQFPSRGEGEISEVCLCLASGASNLGLLIAGRKRPGRFTLDECDFLVDLGRIISLAVENRLVLSGEWVLEPKNWLTGFCSQNHFKTRVSEEIKRVDRYGGVFSVLIAGIDNFDRLSPEKKELVCREILSAIAPLFKQGLRDMDLTGRCNETELAVLLPHTDEKGCLRVADRLISGLRQTELKVKYSEKISFSIGAATYPDDSTFCDRLVEAADIALCSARACGGNRVMTCREAKSRL